MLQACPPAIHERGRAYDVAAPETDVTVRRGSIVAIPLYDGSAVLSQRGANLFRYLGTIAARSTRCRIDWPSVAARRHASNRFALYEVRGAPGDGATIWVKLPPEPDNCYDCRLVHFFVHIG